MSSAWIVAAARTPIGKLQGALASVPAPHLGAVACRAALSRSGIAPADVDEVILGNVLSAGLGQAPARQAALGAGLPPGAAAVTINKVCGSGLKAVMLADQAIRAGDARIVLAGGMESMSRAPHLLVGARGGWKFGHQQVIDSMLHDGLWCASEDQPMGAAAEHLARSRGISRSDQDAFACESHRRAIAAHECFQAEIAAVTIDDGRASREIRHDEGPRADATLASLAKLRPAFAADGAVTAGNASQISDGAAAVVVASAEVARSIETPLRARIVATATSGVAPKDLFIAPVSAIEKVLAKARLTLADVELVELNEAFAVQCLACMRMLSLDPAKTNVRGGAIALGHPIGASGARVLVTLLHALAERNLRLGLASLCLGGGNAVAMIVQRE